MTLGRSFPELPGRLQARLARRARALRPRAAQALSTALAAPLRGPLRQALPAKARADRAAHRLPAARAAQQLVRLLAGPAVQPRAVRAAVEAPARRLVRQGWPAPAGRRATLASPRARGALAFAAPPGSRRCSPTRAKRALRFKAARTLASRGRTSSARLTSPACRFASTTKSISASNAEPCSAAVSAFATRRPRRRAAGHVGCNSAWAPAGSSATASRCSPSERPGTREGARGSRRRAGRRPRADHPARCCDGRAVLGVVREARASVK